MVPGPVTFGLRAGVTMALDWSAEWLFIKSGPKRKTIIFSPLLSSKYIFSRFSWQL
jgi:hypothetical protein